MVIASPRPWQPPALTGADLRAMRTLADVTLAEVAQAAGVSPSLVAAWERADAPIGDERAQRLLDVLMRGQRLADEAAAIIASRAYLLPRLCADGGVA